MKKRSEEMQTLRAGVERQSQKFSRPAADPPHKNSPIHKQTDRTDYNTLRCS